MVDQMGGGGIISMYGKTAVYETWKVFSGRKYRGTSSIFFYNENYSQCG